MGILERLSSHQQDYNPLLTDEKSSEGGESDSSQDIQSKRQPRHKHCSTFLLHTTTAVLAAALCTITALYLHLLQTTAPRQVLGCGSSLEDAEAAGCTFDILSKSWLRPECPRYGTEEYVVASRDYNMAHWQYFVDAEGTAEYDHQQLPFEFDNRPGEVWSWAGTDREHMAHCAWILIRLAHAYKMGDRVDILTANFPHTKHCTLQLLDRAMSAPNLDKITTRGDVVFGSC